MAAPHASAMARQLRSEDLCGRSLTSASLVTSPRISTTALRDGGVEDRESRGWVRPQATLHLLYVPTERPGLLRGSL